MFGKAGERRMHGKHIYSKAASIKGFLPDARCSGDWGQPLTLLPVDVCPSWLCPRTQFGFSATY